MADLARSTFIPKKIKYVGATHIEYDTNSFTGRSGAAVFLLNKDQPKDSVQEWDHLLFILALTLPRGSELRLYAQKITLHWIIHKNVSDRIILSPFMPPRSKLFKGQGAILGHIVKGRLRLSSI
jgi:hypothetical protein